MSSVRHLWAAVWWADSCWHAVPTAHPEFRGVGETIPIALMDLERILAQIEPAERRRLRDGTTTTAISRSYLLARVAVVDG